MAKLNILIVDPKPDSRSRTKQAIFHEKTRGMHFYDQIRTASSVTEAERELRGTTRFHTVLVSMRVGEDEIAKLLRNLKGEVEEGKTPKPRVALIVSISQKSAESGEIAERLVDGVDGFLVEPFSVDDTSEVTRISLEVTKLGSAQREVAAAPIVASSLLKEVDSMAGALANGRNSKSLQQQVRPRILDLVKGFSENVRERFLQSVFVESQRAMPNPNPRPLESKEPEKPEEKAEESRAKNNVTIIHR